MSKEGGPTVALVSEKATLIVICHQCRILLYSAEQRNPITTAVAKNTALDHAESFASGHHVSVVSGKSPTLLRETFAVNNDLSSTNDECDWETTPS